MPSSNFSNQAHEYEAGATIQKKCALNLVSKSLGYIDDDSPLIADLGCGTGNIAEIIFKMKTSATVENYDSSQEMLDVAKCKLKDHRASYHCQSIPKGSEYDLIISNFALQWYPNLEEVLGQCLNRLKKEGIFSACIPVAGSVETLRKPFIKAGVAKAFFNFPMEANILEAISDCRIIHKTLSDECLEYESTLNFFKNLHQIGANQPNKTISRTQLRNLIQYHDELFNGKIIVKYKILEIIIKQGQ